MKLEVLSPFSPELRIDDGHVIASGEFFAFAATRRATSSMMSSALPLVASSSSTSGPARPPPITASASCPIQKSTVPVASYATETTHLTLSMEKLLENAEATGELRLCCRNLKTFPKNCCKFHLEDTVMTGKVCAKPFQAYFRTQSVRVEKCSVSCALKSRSRVRSLSYLGHDSRFSLFVPSTPFSSCIAVTATRRPQPSIPSKSPPSYPLSVFACPTGV